MDRPFGVVAPEVRAHFDHREQDLRAPALDIPGRRQPVKQTKGRPVLGNGFPDRVVLLFMIYNGFAVVPAVRGSFLWAVFVDPYYCAVIGFTFNHAAFLSEILRGGLDAVPKGVTEAGRALALSRTQLLFLIRLPLAMRLGLSAYQNEVVLLTKGTAAVSAITLMDILGAANEAVATTYDPFTPLICAAAIYWAIVQLLREAFGRIEKHAQRHLRRGDSDRAVPVAPSVPRTA
jgi:ABC-type arginine/histidine transport system permease subunit